MNYHQSNYVLLMMNLNEEDIKCQATFRILYYCGLRKGELRGLQWKDIDLERKTLSVRKQITDSWYQKPQIV